MLATILPPGAVGADALGDAPDSGLFPEEAALLTRAVEKRRREFAAGRRLARRALEGLGVPPVPILPGPNREPTWPAGVVGSITHCPGYAAAVVAPATALAALGIDAEVRAELPPDALDMVARAEERGWIEARAAAGTCWDRLLFSAKESVFKAWFPLTGRWLEFDAVSVSWNPAAGTFRAALVGGPVRVGDRMISAFDGRYLVQGDHVLTLVALEAAG
jgi:4'-phosphopantetheinyl transferase EntD